jgi:hypothetical protein
VKIRTAICQNFGRLLAVTVLVLIFSGLACPDPGGQPASDRTPRFFIDCHQCDLTYIRSEITFVRFVRDQNEADIHVLITIQSTRGRPEYTLNFIGRNNFYDIHNTLKYVSNELIQLMWAQRAGSV